MSLPGRVGAWLRRPPPADRTTGTELLIAFAVAVMLPPVAFARASSRLIRHARHVRPGWYLVDLVALLGTLVWVPVLVR